MDVRQVRDRITRVSSQFIDTLVDGLLGEDRPHNSDRELLAGSMSTRLSLARRSGLDSLVAPSLLGSGGGSGLTTVLAQRSGRLAAASRSDALAAVPSAGAAEAQEPAKRGGAGPGSGGGARGGAGNKGVDCGPKGEDDAALAPDAGTAVGDGSCKALPLHQQLHVPCPSCQHCATGHPVVVGQAPSLNPDGSYSSYTAAARNPDGSYSSYAAAARTQTICRRAKVGFAFLVITTMVVWLVVDTKIKSLGGLVPGIQYSQDVNSVPDDDDITQLISRSMRIPAAPPPGQSAAPPGHPPDGRGRSGGGKGGAAPAGAAAAGGGDSGGDDDTVVCSCSYSTAGRGAHTWGAPYAEIDYNDDWFQRNNNTFRCPMSLWDSCGQRPAGWQDVAVPNSKSSAGANATFGAMYRFCVKLSFLQFAPPTTTVLLSEKGWQAAKLAEARKLIRVYSGDMKAELREAWKMGLITFNESENVDKQAMKIEIAALVMVTRLLGIDGAQLPGNGTKITVVNQETGQVEDNSCMLKPGAPLPYKLKEKCCHRNGTVLGGESCVKESYTFDCPDAYEAYRRWCRPAVCTVISSKSGYTRFMQSMAAVGGVYSIISLLLVAVVWRLVVFMHQVVHGPR